MRHEIEARGLGKSYGNHHAVRGINLSVEKGEIVGILGPNGAGKTTLMRLFGAVSAPTGGQLLIRGLDPRKHAARIRAQLGVVPQSDSLDSDLSVRENLVVYARYFGLSRTQSAARADELLELAGLGGVPHSRIGELSGGMRRRLTVVRSLVNDPKILLLDEPTTALDPQSRHHIWAEFLKQKRAGRTIVLTTHFMSEAEHLCDRIFIMSSGRIIASGTPAALISDFAAQGVIEIEASESHVSEVVAQHLPRAELDIDLDRATIYTDQPEADLSTLVLGGLQARATHTRRTNLEDVFLRLTGRRLHD